MQISVIIPVINEQSNVTKAIDSAWLAGADEVIVVDGGSTDETPNLANNSNCSFFQTTPGRAKQQNHGAELANGDVVLFLHADTWLVENACEQIRDCLAKTDAIGGAFQQKIESNRKVMRWIESGNARRVRWFSLPYGDQGIFVRKSVFDAIGGFPDWKLMEDYRLSELLRTRGKLVLLSGPLHVNARRWEMKGPLRQTLLNWRIVLSYKLGWHPDQLAKLYRRHDV